MTKIVAMRGDTAVVERASVAIGEDGDSLAVNERRISTKLWVSPATFSRMQDSGSVDYYPLDTDPVNQLVLCSLASTQTSHGVFTTLYKSSGIPDENGDFTFTKVADCAAAPFSTTSAGKTFSSCHVLADGSWLLAWNAGYVWRSTDQGATWNIVIGSTGPVLWPFSWAGVDGAHIVVGGYTNQSKIWISHDYGSTWEMVLDTALSTILDIDEAGATYNSHVHTCVWDPTSNHTAAYISRGDTYLRNGIVFRIKESVGPEPYEVDTDFLYRDAGITITGITNTPGSPVVVNFAPFGMVPVGSTMVRFYGVGGTTQLNSNVGGFSKNFTIAYATNNSVTLVGTDGVNFSNWTAGGVMRLLPFGTGQLIGAGQPTGVVATDDAIYWATESVNAATIVKHDLVTGTVTPMLNIPRLGSGQYQFNQSTLVHFEFRKIGSLYYLPCITDTTTMRTEIYVSPDLEHWASIKRESIAGSDSFWGYQTVSGTINGRCFVGMRTAASTFYGEHFIPPNAAVLGGVTIQGGDTNLLSPAGGHVNDDATFSTPSHGWTKSSSITTSRVTDPKMTGTHSLKVEYTSTTIGVNTAGVYTPNIVAGLGYTPQAGDFISFRAYVKLADAVRRRADFALRAHYTLAGGAAGKTTLIVPAQKTLTFLDDGWGVIAAHFAITGTYSGADDLLFALLGYSIATGDIFYVGGAEVIVRTTDRLEFFKPFTAGITASEYGLVPMAGAGLAWTSTFLWRPEMAEGQIDIGYVPVCRVTMADGSYVELKWVAGVADHGKFTLQRTLAGGGAQAAVLSSAAFQPRFHDVIGVAMGTDPDNDRIYAVLYTPAGTFAIFDVDTGILQPVVMQVGLPASATDTGVGDYTAVQVFNTAFITDSSAVIAALGDLRPSIRIGNTRIGLLLPV